MTWTKAATRTSATPSRIHARLLAITLFLTGLSGLWGCAEPVAPDSPATGSSKPVSTAGNSRPTEATLETPDTLEAASDSPLESCEALSETADLSRASVEKRWKARESCPQEAAAWLEQAAAKLPGEAGVDARLKLALVQGINLSPPQLDRALAQLERARSDAKGLGLRCLEVRALELESELRWQRTGEAAGLERLQQALSLLPGCSDLSVAGAVHHQLSNYLQRENRVVEAWDALEKAVVEASQAGREDHAFFYRIKQAQFRHDLGDISDGGLEYLRLLEETRLRKLGREAELHLSYACLLVDLDELEGARAELEQTLPMLTPEKWGRRHWVGVTLTLAQVNALQNRLDEAERLLNSVDYASLSVDSWKEAWQLVDGELRLRRGDYDGARRVFEALLSDFRRPESAWRAGLGLGRVELASGRLDAARRRLWAAVDSIEQEHRSGSSLFRRLAYQGQRFGLYEQWLEVLLQTWERQGKAVDDRTFQPSTAFVSGILSSDSLLAAVDKVSSQAFVSALYRDRRAVDALRSPGELDALPGLDKGWTSGAELRRRLPPGTAVLILQPLKAGVLGLAVQRDRIQVRRLPVSQTQLVEELDALRIALDTSPQSPPVELDLLGEQLLKPFADLFHDEQAVGFVLGGGLERLPVSALRLNGRYLVELASPFELPALGALAFLPDSAPTSGPIHVFAASYGADLPGLSRETDIFKQPGFAVKSLTGEQASLDGVLQNLGSAEVLHFATHARAPEGDRGQLLRDLSGRTAALELARGTRLSAEELQRQKIKARLVVLSACETYVGRPVPLETGFGALHRSALVAGAEAAIASRWKVGDAATVALMEAFYTRLAQDGRAKALASAQRTLLRSLSRARINLRKHATLLDATGPLDAAGNAVDVPFAAPWSWAGFTLVGRWN